MRSAASRVLLGVLVSGLVVPPSLLAVNEPGAIRGARFTFSAAASGSVASGRGILDGSAPLGGAAAVSVVVGRGPGNAGTIVARVRSWRLTSDETSARLALRIEIRSTNDRSACPVGAHGTVRLVDAKLRDSVRISFVGDRCKPFARLWRELVGSSRARVAIHLLRRGR